MIYIKKNTPQDKPMQALSLKSELNLIQTKSIQVGTIVKMSSGDNIKITKIYRDRLGSSHVFDFDNLSRNTNHKAVKMQYIF